MEALSQHRKKKTTFADSAECCYETTFVWKLSSVFLLLLFFCCKAFSITCKRKVLDILLLKLASKLTVRWLKRSIFKRYHNARFSDRGKLRLSWLYVIVVSSFNLFNTAMLKLIELNLLMQYWYRSRCKYSIEEPQEEPYSQRVINGNR